MPAPPEYEVVIAGGGPVGTALALALDAAGLRCAVLEAAAATPPAGGQRALALSLSSQRILQALGLWAALRAAATPVRRVHVSERGRFGALRLDGGSIGEPALGYVVEAQSLQTVLDAALARSGCTRLCPARLLRTQDRGERVQVWYAAAGAEGSASARLLVGADGAESAVRGALGIDVERRDYGQSAIVAAVTPERDHQGTAFERFTPEGPFALLPLAGRRCALVWTVARAQAAAVLAMDDARFAAAAGERSGGYLGRFDAPGPRHAYPLHLVRSRRRHGPRAVLIGNAAQLLHPNAAQGLNLGLRDAAMLAEQCAGQQRAGADPGAESALAAFAAARSADARRVIALSDGLARLFYNDFAPLGCARRLGLMVLDRLPPAKRALLRVTTGLAAPVPRLVRGLPP